jgi:hypothetical protein
MLTILINAFVFAMFFLVAFYPKGYLTYKICKQCSPKKMTVFKAINCYVPMYNNVLLRNSLYGKSNWVKVCNSIFLGIWLLILILRFLLRGYPELQVLMTGLVYFDFVFLYVIELLILWDLSGLFERKSYRVLSVILQPLAAFLLALKVDRFFRENKDEIEGTFEG